MRPGLLRARDVERGDGDRGRRVRGRGDRPRAQVVEVVPRRDHGDHARRRRRVERERDDVAARLDLRLADREVEDVHAVPYRGLDRGDELRCVPVRAQARVGAHERLVVPEVRARRDAGDDTPARRLRPRVTGRDARDVRPVARVVALDRDARPRVLGGGRRKRARHDDLRIREARLPLREPGRHRVARRVEERVRVVDAGVDDPDLHALPSRVEAGAPEAGRADRLRRGVELRRIARRVEDVAHPWKRSEARHLLLGEHDREPVCDEAVLPPRARIRELARKSAAEGPVLGRDARSAVRRVRERRRLERDDDLDTVATSCFLDETARARRSESENREGKAGEEQESRHRE